LGHHAERLSRWYQPVKRGLDMTISATTLLVASPLLIGIALAIRWGSPGPVFYRGLRVGRWGTRFYMLKFRTMVVDAERRGGTSTADDDPRITRVGAWLRRRKLDELPQFINVLKGEMSLVGPRPQVEHDVADYTEEEKALLSVRPGITDWASLRFRNEGEILKGEPDPDEAYIRLIRPEKLRLGLEYVRRQSLAVDLRILFETVRAVAGGSPVIPRTEMTTK
jgi:lipopolysaccharide/colanic/teichoic acid biosynthesis glycosyltransferase